MKKFSDGMSALLESNDASENLKGLRTIDSLLDVSLDEAASKVSSYLCAIFETKPDQEVLVLASGVLGHLARSGGAMTADEAERQVKNALEWLRGRHPLVVEACTRRFLPFQLANGHQFAVDEACIRRSFRFSAASLLSRRIGYLPKTFPFYVRIRVSRGAPSIE